MRNRIVFYLNGVKKEPTAKESSMMLAEYLRYEQNLTGTKIVCAEGDCGACSVLRLYPHHGNKEYLPVNSCITLIAQLDGSSIVTVDALKKDDSLHEVQKAMVKCHGSQCGFCTPGFVMAITGLVEEKISKKETNITEKEAKNCMTGNLCRCTGYGPIISAATEIEIQKSETIKKRFYSDAQEKDLISSHKTTVQIEDQDFSFYAPTTLKEACEYLNLYPDARILAGSSDLGVVHNKRKLSLNKVLSLHLIGELYKMEEQSGVVSFGARVTHTDFRNFLKDRLPEMANYLDIFASPQIKNIGTVVGNVANASPIGDTPPALLALDATVVVQGPKGQREVQLNKFFLAYRKTDLQQGELISQIKFKLPDSKTSIRFFKNSNRKDLDISAVNLAMKVSWKDSEKKEISDILIAAGGVAATPLRFYKTEDFLKNSFDIEGAVKELHSEFKPLSDLRASSSYRHVVVENYFRKFFEEVRS